MFFGARGLICEVTRVEEWAMGQFSARHDAQNNLREHFGLQTREDAVSRPEFRGSWHGLQTRATYLHTPGSTSDDFRLTAKESEKFLRIVAATSKITCHYDLFLLLQNEVQYFIPHQIFIAAWGDINGARPNLDVISAIQGIRTGKLRGCGIGTIYGCAIEQLPKTLFKLWVAGGRQPLLIDATTPESQKSLSCNCALHVTLRQMQSILVHGVRNERDNLDSLYVALNPMPIRKNGQNSHERDLFLVDSLIAQIDIAFRKVAAMKPAGTTSDQHVSQPHEILSPREQEILNWIAEGKTNAEIAVILGISSFTVKNHAQRIFRKLDVSNRTEAVSKRPQELIPVL
jgi:transcriptional regulator EpsA